MSDATLYCPTTEVGRYTITSVKPVEKGRILSQATPPNAIWLDESEARLWIHEVKQGLPAFLEEMQGKTRSGYYRYSYSGDRYTEAQHWGLGNTTFAAKCWYTIGPVDELSGDHRAAMVAFIRSFAGRHGLIYDRFLRRRALPTDLAITVAHRRWRDTPAAQARRAETRQSYSALRLLGEEVTTPAFSYMRDSRSVVRFLDKLDWTRPWGAGSHFSHLLFFLVHSDHPERGELIDECVRYVQLLQRDDGSWYQGAPSLAQRINGAMKVITGLKVIGRTSFDRSRELIDTCLKATHDSQACDNFNIVYVLSYAARLAPDYRQEEIRRFSLSRLAVYRRYYYAARGGFSFWEGAANQHYYGALVSAGLDEPDLHGTTLFMWGLSIISELLGVNEELQLREFDA